MGTLFGTAVMIIGFMSIVAVFTQFATFKKALQRK